MTGTVSALDPVDVLARTFERAHVPALFANAGRKETPHTVPLPPGEVLDLAHCLLLPAGRAGHTLGLLSIPPGIGLWSALVCPALWPGPSRETRWLARSLRVRSVYS